jgi:hypothetical protein
MVHASTAYRFDVGDWSELKAALNRLRQLLALGEETLAIQLPEIAAESKKSMGGPSSIREKIDVPDLAPLIPVRDRIRELSAKWRKGEASEAERYELSVDVEELADAAGYQYFKPLSEKLSTLVAGRIASRGGEEVTVPVEGISSRRLRQLLTALDIYASSELKTARANDVPELDMSRETQRGRILARAVDQILRRYGAKMLYATTFIEGDETAIQSLQSAALHHSSERWDTADEETKSDAAEKALYWTIANIPQVTSALQKLQRSSHRTSSLSDLIAAYAQAILADRENPEVKAVLDKLAELRLRWGPITYGPNIYVSASRELRPKEEWSFYQTMIHEALHSAEHPAFSRFLANALPESVQSDVREGIVEYLTQTIWQSVLSEIHAERSKALHVFPSQALPSTLTTAKKMIASIAKMTSYEPQVAMVESIIKLLDSGKQRLEAAYFTGNVEAFLPRMIEAEPMEEEFTEESEEEFEEEEGEYGGTA